MRIHWPNSQIYFLDNYLCVLTLLYTISVGRDGDSGLGYFLLFPPLL